MTEPRKSPVRVALLVAALWLLPVTLSALSSPDTPDARLIGNISCLLFAPLFLLLAAALGDWVLSVVFRLEGEFPGRGVFGAGLGFGVFSIGTLLVGLVIVPPVGVVWAVLLVMAVLLSERSGAALRRLGGRASAFLSGRDWVKAGLVAVMSLLVFLNVLRSFVPPLEYDELEYHLAAPAKYMRDGRISFIRDNAYAAFPANVEMLFLDGMMMRGSVDGGLALGRLINVGLGLLAACAAGACASAMFSPAAALPAAAILYTWPSVNHVTVVGYVELGLMLYVCLALLAAHEYARSGGRPARVALFGVVCALAVACKYPAALFVCVPAGLFVVMTAGRKLLTHGAVFAAAVLVVLSAWLVRDFAATRNPVYPLLYRAFDGPNWSDRKEARWQNAHSPKDYSPGRMWKSLWETAAERYPRKESPLSASLLLVVFAPLGFARREWRKTAGVLLALTVMAIVLWLLFTHRIPRFLMPWLVPLVVLNAAGAAALENRRRLHVIASAALILLAAVEATATFRIRDPKTETALMLGALSTDEAVAAATGKTTYDHGAIMFINSRPKPSKTLFYGEARTLYVTADAIAPTVFDENPFDEIVRAARTPEDILSGVQRLNVTHIYVNLDELYRLQWSYAFPQDAPRWHGYSTLFDNDEQKANLREFLARHCRVVYPAALEERYQRYMRDEFISVMGSHARSQVRDQVAGQPADGSLILPAGLLVNVPAALLPELPPELHYLLREPPGKLQGMIWRRLQFCVYEIESRR